MRLIKKEIGPEGSYHYHSEMTIIPEGAFSFCRCTMPIKPENKNKYPANWNEIRERIWNPAETSVLISIEKQYKEL